MLALLGSSTFEIPDQDAHIRTRRPCATVRFQAWSDRRWAWSGVLVDGEVLFSIGVVVAVE
jgi:hypothetical protein